MLVARLSASAARVVVIVPSVAAADHRDRAGAHHLDDAVGRSTSTRPSILSRVPVISKISASGATSTTRARNTSRELQHLRRAIAWSARTLISASSRATAGRAVMSSTRGR